ncbi:unnamed protein product [Allacma fusca]|uniref:G-protein coupled receptors family 1 profile domain-containing protein n=1 Tax=Allacma fusca TaxID=39272 RepID=A0A8J2LQI6_9HEXA|nr:unnamed protein product [Allacma fusca]
MAEYLMVGDNYSDAHNNTNYTEYGENMESPTWASMLVQILYAIVCIVGLGGNTLVIYVVVRFSKMQTVTNLYIVNLAIADELFLIGVPFLISTMNLGYWPFGKIACKAFYTSTSINQITSSMFLLIMSADRYLAVCHPIRAPKWRTPLIAKLVALTAWTLSALIMVPTFMYANTLEINNKTNCNIFWPESDLMAGSTIFIIYSFFLGFFIPFILILIFYILVIRRLRTVGPKRRASHQSNSKSVTIESSCQRNRDRKKSHRKVTKLVLTVITVYFVCWFPFWVTQKCGGAAGDSGRIYHSLSLVTDLLWSLKLVSTSSFTCAVLETLHRRSGSPRDALCPSLIGLLYTPQDTQHSVAKLMMFLLAGCLSYSNSAMNPILYAFLSDNFKKSFLKACTCANRKDANAVLHNENSIFPRHNKMSTRDHNRKPVPAQQKVNELTVPKMKHDSDDDENPVVTSESRPLTSRSGLSDVSKVTQETFIQDGIHMTSL